jgi:hypothetical protein
MSACRHGRLVAPAALLARLRQRLLGVGTRPAMTVVGDQSRAALVAAASC